jgi:hypothetical protein
MASFSYHIRNYLAIRSGRGGVARRNRNGKSVIARGGGAAAVERGRQLRRAYLFKDFGSAAMSGGVSTGRACSSAVTKAWEACFRPVTQDGLPLIGNLPQIEGVCVATHSGRRLPVPQGLQHRPASHRCPVRRTMSSRSAPASCGLRDVASPRIDEIQATFLEKPILNRPLFTIVTKGP